MIRMPDPCEPPSGLLQRSDAQRSVIRRLPDMYVMLAATQLLVAPRERLRALWTSYHGQLDLQLDPVVALATRMIAPVREARRVLRQQNGNVDDAIRQLLQFLELADASDPQVPVVRDAVAHLRSPQDLRAVFADTVRTGTH